MWRCPCGVEGSFQDMALRHRRGWKKRPACNGKLECVYPGTPKPPLEAQVMTPPSAPARNAGSAHNADSAHREVSSVDGTQAPPKLEIGTVHFAEYRMPVPGEEDPDDPEVIARRFNEQLLGIAPPGEDGGFGSFGGGDNLPPGDYRLEPPERELAPSSDRISVQLPIAVRVYFDFARTELGWHRGDGSLSAFIADVVEAHFVECWGCRVGLIKMEELGVG